MKVVITGASGFVGKRLVPLLQAKGIMLLLVGRVPEKLSRLFPDIDSCGYDDLERRATGYDALLHLAVLNSDATAAADEFEAINVGLLLQVLDSAKKAGIGVFVNISTTKGWSSPGLMDTIRIVRGECHHAENEESLPA